MYWFQSCAENLKANKQVVRFIYLASIVLGLEDIGFHLRTSVILLMTEIIFLMTEVQWKIHVHWMLGNSAERIFQPIQD